MSVSNVSSGAVSCLVPLLVLISCRYGAGTPEAAPDTPEAIVPDSPMAGEDFYNATDPRPAPVDVVPTPEAGEQPYVDALRAAQHAIDVEVYLMGYGGILDQLQAKAGAGVSVRVILDRANMDTTRSTSTC